jgi:ATP phosphoribosyltransferase regulatory subunit
MMGLRADITPQIARLATTRLATAPRPLRLTYSGQCLRVRGSHLQPERQISQAGIELIGPDTVEADAEIILTAVAALAEIGISGISVDLTAPRLVTHLLDSVPESGRRALARALDRKDAVAVTEVASPLTRQLLELLDATGASARAIPALLAIDLPAAAKIQARRLADTVALLRLRQPELLITVDPVEFRGYQYHTGLCMTLFALGEQAELGRGGRYLCGDTEPATGITLYPDTIVSVAPPQQLRARLYLPYGTSAAAAADCRAQHYATVAGLAPHPAPRDEAARLGCSHIFENGAIHPLSA